MVTKSLISLQLKSNFLKRMALRSKVYLLVFTTVMPFLLKVVSIHGEED